ncbi:MAG: MBL fold metallo-hydrolase, partial [Planctomycetota bacterium]|nr:MBL fold metallo-hydrolase [Planctomycetota bacterium]
PFTNDISGQLVVLGTGTSVGVPALGCGCSVCRSDHPRNKRTRCSVIVGLPEGNLLIDTSPDMRAQLLREGVGMVDSVAYTHAHADHIMGMDDLRVFQFYLGQGVPVYCETGVQTTLRAAFSYAFETVEQTHPGAIPSIEFHEIRPLESFQVLGAEVLPLRLQHGPRFQVLGFRIGNIGYCTDTNFIPDESIDCLADLDVLILDALRYDPHPTHLSLKNAIEVAERIGAKKTYLTHCSCRLDYQTVNEQSPPGIEMAYDGLRFPLS